MFTKQNYRVIAGIINKYSLTDEEYSRGTAFDSGWDEAIENITGDLADYFAKDNPLFDCKKFMIACGLQDVE